MRVWAQVGGDWVEESRTRGQGSACSKVESKERKQRGFSY